MGFDAGSITAYLKLDRSDFDAGIDEAKAKAKELQDQNIVVDASIDPSKFNEEAATVDTKKEELGTDVSIPVSLDDSKVEAEQAVVDDIKKDLGKEVDISVNLDLGKLAEEAAVAKGIIDDATGGSSGGGGWTSLAQSLVDQGANQSDTLSALQALGATKTEANQLLQSITGDTGQKGTALSTAAALATALGVDEGGGGSTGSLAGDLFKSGLIGSADPAGSLAGQLGLLGLSSFSQGGDTLAGNLFGAGLLGSADTGGSLAGQLGLMGLLGGGEETSAGGGGILGALAPSLLAQQGIAGLMNLIEKGGGGSGPLQSGMTALFAGGEGGGEAAPAGLGVLGQAIGLGAPLVPPLVSGLGIGLGGALAGTAVAGAGFGAYGMLASGAISDLSTAYSAQQQLKSGAINQQQYQQAVSGLTPAAVTAIQGGLGNQLSSINDNIIHPLQNEIVGQITQMVSTVATVLPTLYPFLQTATGTMGHFFTTIERGTQSTGFHDFVQQMTTDVGPLMRDFGQVIINVGGGIGHFLEIFASGPAQMVGQWFVNISHSFETWASHFRITKGEMDGFKNGMQFLGDVIKLVWEFVSKLFEGLLPLGLTMIHLLDPVVKLGIHLLHMIPPEVFTAIGALIAVFIILTSWPLLIIAAFVLLYDYWDRAWHDMENWTVDAWHAIYGTVIAPLIDFFTNSVPHAVGVVAGAFEQGWDDAKNWAVDAWQAVYNNVIAPLINFFTNSIPHALTVVGNAFSSAWGAIQSTVSGVWNWLVGNVFLPIGNFFTTVLTGALSAAQSAWNTVWGGIQSVVQAVWSVVKPIFDAITGAIKDITGGIGGILKVGGSVLGGIAHGFTSLFGAEGGLFTEPTMKIIGEAGPELLLPLSDPARTAQLLASVGPLGNVQPRFLTSIGGGASANPGAVTIYVDARGSTNPGATKQAAQTGVLATLPKLREAMQRGAGQQGAA